MVPGDMCRQVSEFGLSWVPPWHATSDRRLWALACPLSESMTLA